MNKITFDEWLQSWRNVQPNKQLSYDLEQGAQEAWDFRQTEIDELKKEVIYQVWQSTDSCTEFWSWDDVDLETYEEFKGEKRKLYLVGLT